MKFFSITRRQENMQKLPETGAVLVEFFLAFIVFLMVVGFLVDISFTYFRYNLLVFASQKVSRRIAVNVRGNNDETALATAVQADLRNYLQGFGIDPDEIGIVRADIETDPDTGRWYLHVQGITWDSFSLMTAFFQTPFTIQTKTRVLIEDPCFSGP